MRLSEKSLKKDANALKKSIGPGFKLADALNAIAIKHGYQSWKHIKPLLNKLKEDTQLKNILESTDIHTLLNAYGQYLKQKKDEAAFFILCHLSEVIADIDADKKLVAQFHKGLYGTSPDYEKLVNLSAAIMYTSTNLGWHQVHGIGCEVDHDAAEDCFFLAAQQVRMCVLPYGEYAWGRFYELIGRYDDASKLYEGIINAGHFGTGGTNYQLARLHLEGRVSNPDISLGEQSLIKASKKKHPHGKSALKNYAFISQLISSSQVMLPQAAFHELVRSANIFTDYTEDCQPDPEILKEIEL